MIGKYGAPDEITATRLIWHNKGPWKYAELVNEESPHDFPVPHKDMCARGRAMHNSRNQRVRLIEIFATGLRQSRSASFMSPPPCMPA